MFPEIDYDKVDEVQGMDMVVYLGAQRRRGARALRNLNFPFRS